MIIFAAPGRKRGSPCKIQVFAIFYFLFYVFNDHEIHSHPFRYSLFKNLFASSELVKRKFSASHRSFFLVISSRICKRRATFPSSTVSVSGPAQPKLDPAGFPPL